MKKYTFSTAHSGDQQGTTLTVRKPLTPQAAEDLKAWLARYEFQLKSIAVYDIMEDGSRKKNDALAKTVGDTAAGGALGFMGGFTLAPLLGAVAVAFNPWLAIVSLVGLPLDIGLLHKVNKNTSLPGTIYSEIELVPDVTEDTPGKDGTRGWFEYCAAYYITQKGWSCAQLTHPKAAAGYRKATEPVPWAEQDDRRRRKATPRKGAPVQHKTRTVPSKRPAQQPQPAVRPARPARLAQPAKPNLRMVIGQHPDQRPHPKGTREITFGKIWNRARKGKP